MRKLIAWTQPGDLAIELALDGRVLSLSGKADADVVVDALDEAVVFVRPSERGCVLQRQSAGGADEIATLTSGSAHTTFGLSWLLIEAQPAALASPPSTECEAATSLLRDAVRCLIQPMTGPVDLRTSLKELLAVIVQNSPATSGMLVLAENGGAFNLVSSYGLAASEAAMLWDKMPHELCTQVLRQNARVLLPEELQRRRANGDSTVFLRGVSSVAGFPVLAEDRLVAVFFVGFDNLLKRLSPELQEDLEAVAGVLGLVVQRAEIREQIRHLTLATQSTAAAPLPPDRLMIGDSEKLAEVYRLIGRLAAVDVPILITGETGTGKELTAKELHRLSARGRRPFVVVNAAAMPETLIESELFGHRRGAFTGALSDRIGLVEQADGGTLFIDEIGELPLAMQAKFLRVLQERSVTRLGETQARPVDFRLACATHRKLTDMVAAGQFREDLYYRITGAEIRLPPLRERSDDVRLLAEHFRRSFAEKHCLPDKEWSKDALAALTDYGWPGNVRELANSVARAFVMAEGSVIQRSDLDLISTSPGSEPEATLSLNDARDEWMRGFLIQALRRHRGKRSESAKALGIGERTLFRYLEQLGIRDV